MKFTETKLLGAYLIEPNKIEDERGFFARSWCHDEFTQHGLNPVIAQANVAHNKKKGTVRGLHFQVAPFAEVKVVRCTKGAIYDVIVDLRPESPTFKQWLGFELTDANWNMVYVPQGFAQGYQTLVDDTNIYYQTSQRFAPQHAKGVRYNDPAFSIKWPLEVSIISKADGSWPDFLG